MHLANILQAIPGPTLRLAPAAGLAVLLGACSAPDVGFDDAGWTPFSGGARTVALDSLTAQRVRGHSPEFAPVLPEPGNVWPDPEPERPTLLGGPEEAFRNIPEYRPSLIEGAPPARSPVPSPAPGAFRGSGAALDSLPPATPPQRFQATPAPTTPAPPPRSAVGQVTTDPSGRPAVVTNEAGRVRGVTQPGAGGGGAVIRDGNVETWIGPDGRTSTRVVPSQ
jgi:hypothetical protein